MIKIYPFRISLLAFFLFFNPGTGIAEDEAGAGNIPDVQESRENGRQKSENVNVDARMLYGQYNNISSDFSIIQNLDFFTYQLSSDLKRSNDFEYTNSSFYESDIGFTGRADISETWKLRPEMEVNNESHGMYSNPVFSREEKDKIIVNIKNEYKPTPSRWDFNFGGGQYVHRLVSSVDSSVERSGFNKANEEIGWEYIWSASNRFGFKHNYSHYFYFEDEIDDDRHMSNEIYFSFKIIEYLMIGMGGIVDWDADNEKNEGWFPSGNGSISTSGMKYLSLELSYIYDLVPFNPEDFYFEQKYISPNYELLPGKEHNVNLKGELDFRFESKSNFSVKQVRLKGKGSYIKNDNFYNYFSLAGNVITAEEIPIEIYRFKGDMITDLRIFNNQLKFIFNYEYNHFKADRNITYNPIDIFGGTLNFRNNGWEVEWDNKYIGEVFINPDVSDTRKLESVIIGSLKLQLKMVKTFYFYARINNLYDKKYSYREGYFEPGITFLSGLRIII
jgi:hypothetical protein